MKFTCFIASTLLIVFISQHSTNALPIDDETTQQSCSKGFELIDGECRRISSSSPKSDTESNSSEPPKVNFSYEVTTEESRRLGKSSPCPEGEIRGKNGLCEEIQFKDLLATTLEPKKVEGTPVEHDVELLTYTSAPEEHEHQFTDHTSAPVEEEHKPVDHTSEPVEEEERKPVEEQRKLVGEQRKLVGEQRILLEEQRKPVNPIRKPVEEQRKLVGEQRKLVGEQRKLLEEQRKPVEVERKPMEDERKPLEDERKPVEDERKPVEEERKPFQGERKPVEGERKPVEEQRKPTEDERKPFQGERKPVENERKPVEDERKPLEDERKPVDRKRKPVEVDRKPVEEERKPLEDERTPVDHTYAPVEHEHESSAHKGEQSENIDVPKGCPPGTKADEQGACQDELEHSSTTLTMNLKKLLPKDGSCPPDMELFKDKCVYIKSKQPLEQRVTQDSTNLDGNKMNQNGYDTGLVALLKGGLCPQGTEYYSNGLCRVRISPSAITILTKNELCQANEVFIDGKCQPKEIGLRKTSTVVPKTKLFHQDEETPVERQ